VRIWKYSGTVLINVCGIWLGKSRGKQESLGLRRKLSVKWMKEGNGRMSTKKGKEDLQKTEE
jgi:hypothetical protein